MQIRRLLRDAADTICQLHDDLQLANTENDRLREERDEFKALFELKDTQFNNVLSSVEMIKADNARLREQMERLLTLLRNDCDIDASWDGLRNFWHIELTENGCLMRDRACKAEAENEELRKLVCAFDWCTENFDMPYRCDQCPLKQTDAIEPECEIRMRKLRVKEKQ